MIDAKTTSAFGATILLFSSVADSQCLSRYDLVRSAPERPVFVLKSCSPAAKYARAKVDDWKLKQPAAAHSSSQSNIYDHFLAAYNAALAEIGPDDQVVEVRPYNDVARTFMFEQDAEHWLFRRSCEYLTLNEPVTLEVQQHCSDTGPTLVRLFGDVVITKGSYKVTRRTQH